MKRFWVSWWSELDGPVGDSTPFDYWITGQRCSNKPGLDTWADENWLSRSHVAMVDAESEEVVWYKLAGYFPDLEQRFVEPQEEGASIKSDRFQGSTGRTSLD